MPVRRKNITAETKKFADHEVLLTVRTRFLAADFVLTPGVAVLPAFPGGKYRLVDAILIANGGAAGGATSINITGTVAGAKVNLLVALVAGLTQSTLLRLGAANATVLANGGSQVALDPSTPVMIERVGSALSGATSIDVLLTYAIELSNMGQ